MFRLDPKMARTLAIMHSAVLVKLLLIFIGYKSGLWLDAKYETKPLFVILLGSLGAGLGLWFVVFSILRQSRR